MIYLHLSKDPTDKGLKNRSMDLIESYLNTVIRETAVLKSERDVKLNAQGIIQDYSYRIGDITTADLDAIQKEIKKEKKKHGLRAALHYHNRGMVQDMADHIMSVKTDTNYKIADAAKMVIATGIGSIATGSAAQALFGAENFDKFLGKPAEKLAQDFFVGNDHYDSLFPAVAAGAFALGTAKLGVSFIAATRDEKETRDFQDYAHLKHAQIGLKQLKKAVEARSKQDQFRPAPKNQTTKADSAANPRYQLIVERLRQSCAAK